MYNRIAKWLEFSTQINRHIEQYTLPQYGNPNGDEQVDSFTIEDCWKNVERYFNRRHAAVRGPREQLRDLLKIAHYMSFIYFKLKAQLKEEDVYTNSFSTTRKD